MSGTVNWPKVYLCMLNRNGKEHLEYAIPSVLTTDYPNYELVIVDNVSTDDSVAYIKKTFPSVKIIQNAKNLGCAGSMNVGIRDAMKQGFEWIIILNNDILIDPRWLKESITAALTDPKIGLIGFSVPIAGVKTPREEFYAAQREYSKVEFKDTKAIPGCAIMVKAEVFENIGLFDEEYFIYGEDNDFEFRAGSAGYRIVQTNIPLWHYAEGASQFIPLKSSYFAMRNTLRIEIKHRGFGPWKIIKWFLRTLRFTCSPFVKIDPRNTVQRRMRPTNNPFINSSLLFRAFLWNVFNYSMTKSIRRKELDLIVDTQRKLGQKFEKVDTLQPLV
jgi:GT2 family glycosyltransferase